MNDNPQDIDDVEMVFYAELGGVYYKRRPSRLEMWDVEDNYRVLREPKLRQVAIRSSHLFLGIDNEGRFCYMNNPLTAIEYNDSFEDTNYKTLYDLGALDSSFTTMRCAWFLNNGNVLVFESCNSSTGHIGGLWLIDNADNTFRKVLTFGSADVMFLHRGNIAIHGDEIWYGEYGTWGNAKLYLSTNNGESFSLVKDFAVADNVVPNGTHIHGIIKDVFWNRIWVATGDYANEDGQNSKRIWWSDNGGLTWSFKNLTYIFGDSLSPYDCVQFLTGYADKDFIIWGGDDYNNCIYRSIRNDKDVIPDRVFYYAPNETNKVTQYTGEMQKLSNGLIVVPVLNGDSGNFPQQTRLMGTFDGITWYELYAEGLQTEGRLPVANDGVLVERDGYLYYGSVTSDLASGQVQICNLIKFMMPRVE